MSEISFSDAVDELNPAQTAAKLGVSHTLVVKLLENGTIDSRRVPGDHQPKIAPADLEVYQEKKATGRRLIGEAIE